MNKLQEGQYLDVQVLRMGQAEDGSMTLDRTEWVDGQSCWNVYATVRDEPDNVIREVADFDIPLDCEELAHEIAGAIEDHFIE